MIFINLNLRYIIHLIEFILVGNYYRQLFILNFCSKSQHNTDQYDIVDYRYIDFSKPPML